MKGVILAGGLATRLYPLTFATNKHLLPVYDRPMIYYPINTMLKAGISEILVVTSGPHAGDFIRVLKNGKELGVKHLEYAYQERPNGGIADALLLARDFAEGKNLAVILGDNTTDADISGEISKFKSGAVIFLKRYENREDLKRFGVPVFDSRDKTKISHIEEKPEDPKSNFAVTGMYLYDSKVFEYADKCKPSKRNELEITDVNNFYAKNSGLSWSEITSFWSDAGTFDTLYQANRYWAEKKAEAGIRKKDELSKD